MTDSKKERELPDGQQRLQVRTNRAIREYVSERSEVNGNTYSEQVNEWLPDDPDETVPGNEGDIVVLKLVPDVHGKVDSLSGRLRHEEVIAYYAMQAAIENGDIGRAAEFASFTPTTLLRAMQEGQPDV